MCTDAGHGSPVPMFRPEHEAETTEPLALVPADAVSLVTLVDNSSDLLLPDQGPVKRAGLLSAAGAPHLAASVIEGGEAFDVPLAEHGFAVLVTVTRAGRDHRILFDAGMTPDGLVGNMRRLNVDPKEVEIVVLSHGHTDHVTGLDGFIRAVGPRNLPLVVHPGAWARRRIAIPGVLEFELPSPSGRALAEAGLELVEARRPSLLFDGCVLVTGEVDRTSGFEQGMPFHEKATDGGWEPDPLILDDQALVVNVARHGLVVLTGCGHSGIVNIVRYARRLTGVDRVATIVGGFHLSGPAFEPIIAPTVEALAELDPELVLPAHCSGWRAGYALANRLPDAYVPNAVGSRLELAGQ
ncbi:MAG TPA: MBL fold metallo-hydrolase [Acidimicrobiales bacterium]|nr:MBL fold metallo-hydrolase [Acidimicrobiales bacterium]